MKNEIIKSDDPRAAAIEAQWDEEYCLPKAAANELRKRGVPPPPRPPASKEGEAKQP